MWEYIANRGHKVLSICIPNYAGETYHPIKRNGFELKLFPPYFSSISNFWYFPQLHEIIKDFSPDIIYCMQEPFTYCAYNALGVSKLFDIPFSFFTWENIRKAYPQPWRTMESCVIKEANLAIGGNKDASRILLEKGAKRVIQLPQTGLDVELFVPEPKIHFEERKEPKKILYVGRLVKEKGIEVILRAFDKLGENYILKFVGGRGNMNEIILQHPEYGKRVLLESWTEYERLPKIYNWADIFIFHSLDTPVWKEQMGYCAGEALLCYKPVLASTSKSLMEMWGQSPDITFVQQGDIDAIVSVLKNEDSYKEAKKGREWVVENYSVEKIGDKYIEAFEEVI